MDWPVSNPFLTGTSYWHPSLCEIILKFGYLNRVSGKKNCQKMSSVITERFLLQMRCAAAWSIFRKCSKWQERGKKGGLGERRHTHSKENSPWRKTSVDIDCKNKRVKGRERGVRGGRGPAECEIKRKREKASDVIDAGCCLLYVREAVERQAVLKWINYYSPLT